MATIIDPGPASRLTNGEHVRTFVKKACPPFLLPTLAALLAVVLAFQLGTSTLESYFQHHPFAGDTFSYHSQRLAAAERIAGEGRWAAIDLFLDNPRDPLRSLALALYPSRMLRTLEGALLFNSAAYFCFAAMLAILVGRRTGLAAYGLAVAGAGLAVGIFFDPLYGYPSELPDLPAALFAGAGLFALLLSDQGKRPAWLIWFAVFASLATLTRISAAVYIFVLAAPILGLYLWHVGRVQGWSRAVLLAGVIGLTLSVLIGWFLQRWLLPTLEFYRQAGYALDSSASVTVATTVWPFLTRGLTFSFASFAVLCLVYLSHTPKRGIIGASLFETVWLVLAVPLFLVFWVGLEDDLTQMYYALPGLVLLVVAPVALSGEVQSKLGASAALQCGLPAACILLTAIAVTDHKSNLLNRPVGEDEAKLTRLIRDLAEHFSALKPAATEGAPSAAYQVDVGFNYASRFVIPMMQLAFDRDAKPNMIFMIRESQWRLSYYQLSDADIAATMHNRMDLEINVLAVLADPTLPAAKVVLKDEYTVDMARSLRDHVRSSSDRWRPVGEVNGPYGLVEIYLNKKRSKTVQALDRFASMLQDASADAVPYHKFPERDLVTTELGITGYRQNAMKADQTGLVQEIFQRLGRMSVAEAAEEVGVRLDQGTALIAFPADLEDPRIAPMMLTDEVRKGLALIAQKLQTERDLWMPWGRIDTPFGSFQIYGNATLLNPKNGVSPNPKAG